LAKLVKALSLTSKLFALSYFPVRVKMSVIEQIDAVKRKQGDFDLREAQISATVNTLACLGLQAAWWKNPRIEFCSAELSWARTTRG
jgi:hypothetical protein